MRKDSFVWNFEAFQEIMMFMSYISGTAYFTLGETNQKRCGPNIRACILSHHSLEKCSFPRNLGPFGKIPYKCISLFEMQDLPPNDV